MEQAKEFHHKEHLNNKHPQQDYSLPLRVQRQAGERTRIEEGGGVDEITVKNTPFAGWLEDINASTDES